MYSIQHSYMYVHTHYHIHIFKESKRLKESEEDCFNDFGNLDCCIDNLCQYS